VEVVRRNDWPEVLTKFLAENRLRPFRWGSWDCCLFACNGIREITGVDVAAKYRGRYQTMLGAFRLIGGSVRNVAVEVASLHGFAKHNLVEDARPGDVVLATLAMETLGIVSLARTGIFVTTMGLASFPLSLTTEAWKIG
jgi:hypothetical protein